MSLFDNRIDGLRWNAKSLTLALIAAIATLLLATLSAGAQTEDGDDPAGTIAGRVIVRVQDRTTDGDDDYRIEFGFLPEWAMDEKDPWTEAARTYANLLPSARYLTKARIDDREEADNQRWLRSSEICVPVAAPKSPADAAAPDPPADDSDADLEPQIECDGLAGRVIARYGPHSSGRLRIEFGFLPEWALASTAGTEAAVELYGEELLPRSRYLTASLIANRRDVWLRSSRISVPLGDGVDINITSPTLAFKLLEEVPSASSIIGTITGRVSDQSDAIAITGTPLGLTISTPDVPSEPDDPPKRNLILSGTVSRDATVGSREVTITVSPRTGAPVAETLTIRIEPGDQVLTWSGYLPSTERIGAGVALIEPRVEVGPSEPKWSYDASDKPGICTVVPGTGDLRLDAVGQCHVVATSAAREGFRAGTVRAIVTITTKLVPKIHWRGYTATEATVAMAAPTLIPPVAEVDGHSVDVPYVYDLGEDSKRDGICAVDSEEGTLTALAAGTCIVLVRSKETEEYAAAEPVARSVMINKGSDPFEWDGYDAQDLRGLRADSGPLIPLEPRPRLPEAVDNLIYTYRAAPASVCSVNPNTGVLRPLDEGDCRVTLRGEPKEEFKDKLLAGEVTVTVSIEPSLRIVCLPSSPRVDQSVTCTMDRSGGTPATYSWSGGASSGNSPTYATSFSSPGKKTISLAVRYRDGHSDSAFTVVDVEGGACNTIGDIGPLDSGQSAPTINLDSYCRDPENSYAATSSNNSIAAVHLSGARSASLTVTAARNSGGTATITVTATNPAGRRGQTSFRVTVNEPPTCEPISDITIDQNDSEVVTVRCSDQDGDDITLSAEPSNSSIATASTSGSQVTVEGEGIGTATITVTASDGNGGTDSTSFNVTVTEENQPPDCRSIGSIPPIVLENSYSTRFRCSDPDGPPESITVTVESDDSRIIQVGVDSNPVSLKIIGNLRSTRLNMQGVGRGTTTIRATATDAEGGPTTISFRATVDYNRPPQCDSISDVTLEVRASEIVSARCFDPNGFTMSSLEAASGDMSIATVEAGKKSYPEGTLTRPLTITAVSAGVATITSTGTDAHGGSTDVTLQVTVTGGRPVIDSISCTPRSPVVAQTITCTASLSGGMPTSYSWSGGVTNSESSSYTPYETSFSTSGSKTVSLTVSNSVGSDEKSIDVKAREGQPPTCTGAHRDVAVDPERLGGTSFTIQTFAGVAVTVDCTDPDGQALTLTARSANTSIASVEEDSSKDNTYTIRGVRGAHNDTTTVTVTATDSDGLTGSVSFTITVMSSSPTMQGIRPVTLAVGESDDVTQLSWDPDGDRFTVAVTVGDSSIASVNVGDTQFGTIRPPGHTELFGGRTTLTITGRSVGTTSIAVSTTDVNGSRHYPGISFSVTVNAPEITKPKIDSIECSPSSPRVNQSVICTASLSGGTPTTYSWTGGTSGGRDPSYATSFNISGSQTVSLEVINLGGNDTSSISISVAAETPVNRAPECNSVPNQFVTVIGSARIDLRSYCADPDQDQLKFTYKIMDNYQSRKFSVTTSVYGQPTHGLSRISGRDRGVGNGTINVTATDPSGLSVQTSIAVKVGNEPPTWICDPLPRTYVLWMDNSSETIDPSSCFSDPEGGTLLYRVNRRSGQSSLRTRINGSQITVTSPTGHTGNVTFEIRATDGDDGYWGNHRIPGGASTVIPWRVTVLPWRAQYATCDNKPASVRRGSKIYYFNTTSWTKHYLDLSVTEFIDIVGSTQFHRSTDQMSSSQCEDWNTGDAYDASKLRELVRGSD